MRALAAALLLAAPIAAQQPAASASADDRAAVARASARGALIYAYDQAAWHGSDDMMAKLPSYAQRVGGWVVEGSAEAPVLTFFDRGRTRAVYVARFDHGRLTESRVLADTPPLTPAQQRLVAAQASARAALTADRSVLTCADKPFNTVVLPPETPAGPIAVYFLTPQTTEATIPFGGHYRVEVDAGGHAGPVRPFTRGCLPISTPAAAGNLRQAMAFVTHLLDPTPTEIHVFSSLALHKPVAVATTRPTQRLWIVQGATIDGPRPLPAPSR